MISQARWQRCSDPRPACYQPPSSHSSLTPFSTSLVSPSLSYYHTVLCYDAKQVEGLGIVRLVTKIELEMVWKHDSGMLRLYLMDQNVIHYEGNLLNHGFTVLQWCLIKFSTLGHLKFSACHLDSLHLSCIALPFKTPILSQIKDSTKIIWKQRWFW